VTPEVLAKTYSITGVTPSGSDNNHQAVAEFQGETMSTTDLKAFFTKFVPNATADDATVTKFVGDANQEVARTEASLDIQYIMGVAPGLKSEFWYYSSMDFCGDLMNWTAKILETDGAPLVHSVSYGFQGDLKFVECDQSKAQTVDDNLAKLAAAGFTIIFASGDAGVGEQTENNMTQCMDGNANHGEHGVQYTGTILKTVKNVYDADECCGFAVQNHAVMAWTFTNKSISNNSQVTGRRRKHHGGDCTQYTAVTGSTKNPLSLSRHTLRKPTKIYPSWPASSPWVTAVGGTSFEGAQVGNEEVATTQFGSGGGFSSDFTTNTDYSWQADVVSKYLANAPQLPDKSLFNSGGRATPDVAALGEGYQVMLGGNSSAIGGTSASTPVFAGIISLLNDARMAKGMKQLGFLNPWLYNNTGMFTDITKGSNGIDRYGDQIEVGFNCTAGWDPVTGLGTPIFDKMLAAALS
jgi:subtilase family serine protease